MFKIQNHSFSIKSLKFFNGMEGQGFSLNLYMDGKKVAEVFDDANGGEFNFHWFGERTSDYQVRHYDDTIVTRKGTEAEAIFQNHIFSLPPIPPQPEKGLPEMFTNADIFIDDMIDQIHVQKQVEKLVKKNIIVVKEGQVLTYKIPPNQTYESIKDAFKAKHPKSIVLNEMKTEEIVQIFKDKNLA